MGGTEWAYFTRYQPNFENALQALREEVFTRGAYEFSTGNVTLEGQISIEDEPTPHTQAMADAVRDRVVTIDRLLELAGFEGTHSILDIRRVDSSPDYDMHTVIVPATPESSKYWFGTEQPNRSQVEAALYNLFGMIEFPICFAIYDQGRPVGL